MQNRDRYFYQYALMNLAVLQADFGCYKEAIAAMLETVSTARENRDMICLNFALNWLYHFGRAHPDLLRNLESNSMLGSGKEGLAFLRVKAKETGMWTLWSAVLLGEAKLGLTNGDSVATCFEFLVRSSQIMVERSMKNMFASYLSVSASLWERLGIAHMSVMTCEMFLRCHAQHCMFEEELKMTCRLAATLAGRGKYDLSLQILESLDENSLRSWKPEQYWHKFRGIIKLKRDLNHNNLSGADQLLRQLLQSKADDMDPDLSDLIDILHVDYLIRRNDLQNACQRIEILLSNFKDSQKDVSIKVRLLLWKVILLNKCGRPQRGFTTAMQAASMAWRARLIPLVWASTGAIANILVWLGEFEAAAQLLSIVIPRALECESGDLTGQLYSYLADAYMGLAGEVDPKSPRRTERITSALESVQKAFDCYSAVEEISKQCEMMAKKAMIMKLSGDLVLAADYAAAYVNLKMAEEAYNVRPA
jgi:anaphase-promoting complex subunit 5